MAAIKFDSLDPETRKRVLKALEEQAAEAVRGPAEVGEGVSPRRDPATAEVRETPTKAAAARPGVGDGAPRSWGAPTPKVGEGEPRPPGGETPGPAQRYFVAEHPWAFAWLFGLALFSSWSITSVCFEAILGVKAYDLGTLVLIAPSLVVVAAWWFFAKRYPKEVYVPLPLAVFFGFICFPAGAVTGGFVVGGWGLIPPTVYALYLYWCFRRGRFSRAVKWEIPEKVIEKWAGLK